MQCILWLHNYSRLTGQHYKSRKIYMGLPSDVSVNDNFYSFRNDQLPQKNLEGPKLNRQKLQIFISFLQAKFGAFDFLTLLCIGSLIESLIIHSDQVEKMTSLPNPMMEPPAAMRAASPPLDPPGPRVKSLGFRVTPKIGLEHS